MLLEHILVVQDARRIRHIGHAVRPVRGSDLQRFQDIHIGFLDVRQPRIVRYIREDICIYIIGVVDIPPYADNVRVIFPYEPCPHDRTGIIRRTDGQMDVIVRRIELLLHLVEIRCCLWFVLEDLDLRFP